MFQFDDFIMISLPIMSPTLGLGVIYAYVLRLEASWGPFYKHGLSSNPSMDK